jgi:hypothetical protein
VAGDVAERDATVDAIFAAFSGGVDVAVPLGEHVLIGVFVDQLRDRLDHWRVEGAVRAFLGEPTHLDDEGAAVRPRRRSGEAPRLRTPV